MMINIDDFFFATRNKRFVCKMHPFVFLCFLSLLKTKMVLPQMPLDIFAFANCETVHAPLFVSIHSFSQHQDHPFA